MQPLANNTLLSDIVARLRSAFDPCTIYFFGSASVGSAGPDSDLDILVVVPVSELGFYQRAALAYKALRGIPVPVDVQVYTRAEFEPRAALPVSFERTVVATGRVLHAA